MDKAEQKRRAKAGWEIVTVQELLGLTDEEMALIEMRLALSSNIKQRRLDRDWTQVDLAKQLGSSQSRVAKMEAADMSVSLDLMIRCLLQLGATQQQVGRIIGRKAPGSAA